MAYTTIDDPSAYFHTQLYTGTGSELSVTNGANAGDFKPDWIWIKQRNAVTNHGMFDSNRGVKKNLKTDTTDAESTENESVKTFNTDGFTLGTSGDYNGSSDTHVAWQWIANGGTTASNTDGSITSTVQANTTAGFSIVSYTGTGSTATVGHSLGVTPSMIIIKSRNTSGRHWSTYHSSLGATKYVYLDDTDAEITSSSRFNDTAPTSSVFTVNTDGDVNGSSTNHIAYCFAEIQGYSKFGSYKGNGNADGPFIYTGFKPAYLLIKRVAGGTGTWLVSDNQRDPINPTNKILKPNVSNAENTGYWYVDYLSNGFKVRLTDAEMNGDGHTMIYMAFAEHPFVSSKGVPTTAR